MTIVICRVLDRKPLFRQYPDRFIRADLNADGTVDQADLGIFLAIMGMSENNAVWARFTWDAENRLIGFEPQEPAEGSLKVAFKYDYMGRRVEKAVYAWDPELNGGEGGWEDAPTLHRRFVWYNWLLLEELDVDASGAVTGVAKKYTWGLDLAGQWGGQTSSLSSLEGAGGIGGLLAAYDVDDPGAPNDPTGSYIYFYDANGNVGQLIDWENDGTLVAKYEYDPYGGNLLDPDDPNESGPYAAENPFRFSTKYFDAETALGYWGYRYYNPGLGRWLSRDPIGEEGSLSLYAALRNDPARSFDADGRQDQPATQPTTQGTEGDCCGPEVGDHVRKALSQLENWFGRLSSDVKKADTCIGIWNPDTGWDIYDLAATGGGDDWIPPRIEQAGCGTGKCKGTVQYNGGCYRAGELNYILYGRINRLWRDTVWKWTTFKGLDEDGKPIYEDPRGRRIRYEWWDPEWMSLSIFGYRLAVRVGWIPEASSAPVGPGGAWCRAAWAAFGYHRGSTPISSRCQVKECGTECCTEPYKGPPFLVRISGAWLPDWTR